MTHQISAVAPVLLLCPALAAYGWGVIRLTGRGDRWPWRRTVAAMAGIGVLAGAVMPPLAEGDDVRIHVLQHLLIAMVAPALLALSAPVTLALRTVPPAARRRLVKALHSRATRVLACAPFVLFVDVGGMYAYYLTPLFAETDRHTWLHLAVHAHMFVAGCLLAWYLIGRDPMPARPSTRSAVLVLLLAAGSHDLLAKLMFAYDLPSGAGSAVDIRVGAQLMFYGGDAVELALALAIMLAWYSRTGRELDRQRRRLNAVAVRSATSTRLLRQGALRPDAGDNGNRFESD